MGQESLVAQQLNPIVNAGPSQNGWSPQLAAAVNTQNINAEAAANRNAKMAVNNSLAGQGGGGTSGLTSGIDSQIAGTIASSSENALSAAQEQAQEANSAQGNANWQRALGGEQALSGQELGAAGDFSGQSAKTYDSAFGQANTVNQQKGTILGDLGKVVGLAGDFVTGGVGNMSSDSSAGENVGNFFTGGLQALSGGGS